MTPFESKALVVVLLGVAGICCLILVVLLAMAAQNLRGPKTPAWTGEIAEFGSHVEFQGAPTPDQVDYLSELMNRPLRSAFEWPRWDDHHIDPSQDPYHGTRKDWRAHA